MFTQRVFNLIAPPCLLHVFLIAFGLLLGFLAMRQATASGIPACQLLASPTGRKHDFTLSEVLTVSLLHVGIYAVLWIALFVAPPMIVFAASWPLMLLV